MFMFDRDRLGQRQGSSGAIAPILCYGALGLVLCWLIVRNSVAAYLAWSEPQWALRLNASEPTALSRVADKAIDPTLKQGGEATKSKLLPRELDELKSVVERAIALDPLRARNYRLLAQIAEMQGAKKLASAAMVAAARHSLHDGYAAFWLMGKALENKNFQASAYYADVLLRSGSVSAEYVLPVFARMLESKGAGGQEVIKLLTGNPPWRGVFFSEIYKYLSDVAVPLELFLNLRETAAPASPDELNAFQWILYQKKLYPLAYYVWLQFLPPEKLEDAGFLFNGRFEEAPTGSPFDWQAPVGTNVTVDYAAKSENETDRALVVGFNSGRAEFPGVSQLTMLTPGRYRVRGSYKGDLEGPRGVEWAVSCMDGPVLGQSQRFLGLAEDWRRFEFVFAVPDKGCAAQVLRLGLAARSPSEEILSGEIWFDDLSITPN
jgi:hypothetical protein